MTRTVPLQLLCGIQFIEFEGLADGRSLRNVLRAVAPRRVAVVHGTREAAEALKAFCDDALPPGTRAEAPAAGVVVDFSVATSSYSVTLAEALYEGLAFHQVADYEVAWVDGVLTAAASVAPGAPPSLVLDAPPVPGAAAVAAAPGGDWSEAGSAPAAPPRREAVFVGCVKLTDFKQILAAASEPCEFRGGALVCAGGQARQLTPHQPCCSTNPASKRAPSRPRR